MTLLAKVKRCGARARLIARRLADDTGGFAAVEFAMIVPVLIAMLLGCVEISDASTVSVRIINISGAVANMVARCAPPATTGVDAKDLDDVMRISDTLIGRYPIEPLKIQIIAVKSDANGRITVNWSYDHSRSSPLAPGTVYTGVPIGLISPSSNLIVVKASYGYHSPVGQYIHGTISLSHTSYEEPRGGAVNFPAGPCTSAG